MKRIAFGVLPACVALTGTFALEASAAAPSADLYVFVAEIAPPTASAKIHGDQHFEKIVTIGRNPQGELVVTGIQVVAPSGHPKVEPGASAIYIAHFEGQCAAPYGGDDYASGLGVATFVSAPSGRFIWELAAVEGRPSIRLVDAKGPAGPWEAFQKDPEQYRTYACEKYAG